MFYSAVRKLLFNFDPEAVHYFAMNSLKTACNISFAKKILERSFQRNYPSLQKNIFGLSFKNPVGLGAGFDKNASYLTELETLGFGFVEIGTVTPKPQSGNDKPRLFRLPEDKALINRMGFNNDGVGVIRKRLEDWKTSQRPTVNGQLVIGGNIGKNKVTPNEDAWKDYDICFRELFDCVDYFVVNVSSPNTPGLRELQEKDSLRKILAHLQTINHTHSKQKPLLLKIAPDLNHAQLDDIISLAFEVKLDGIVATNTTISRDTLKAESSKLKAAEAGGLSGKPVFEKSNEVLRYLISNSENKIPVIASGGIFTGEDAKVKLDAGASLVQVWTGFIYEGPSIVKNINRFLQHA
ncbi:quinone-dependent dihydroorotate dehydrogenase [Parafilimonas terrae]|uniref:Dihydroorotate dehydrogenase (quinone) n=1 Tax=Parafilimonas terrae TaxID=1465490 RepID=A0A1I5RSV1_9BACT|nr:quinone-dependent dihydroorotate dehydrogenase [Parafilimonas terrae]SFP61573.1 dihydroorotate oxidase A [Parafilimonas terrae]